ncbi:clathrin heavy chain linker domain-containing protein 1 isoform X1 [Electrophorus electricus]|uniref:clathrin heavy chain linker domain-containing protein 1 isoform X1 n=1 Tax=Electrophorus electricus TaxID=8005 RepID=UPI0015CF9F79|nr:clathrin heavy chain linker domain-containing protein 1 isoform X1 [Electrophorus electricus]
MDFNSKTVPLITSARDRDFLKSLYEFIAGEKESLCCPDEGSDEQRHTVYSAAFDKVIDYATSYKTILTAIKKEYDCLIASIKNNDRKVKVARGKLKTMMAQPTSLMYCRRRSVQLQERIAIIQKDTAEVQAKLKRLQEFRKKEPPPTPEPSDGQAQDLAARIPGLTFCEMLNPEALAKHLGFLEQKQADLLNKKKNQYVPVQVKADLEIKMRAYLNKKDELALENDKLQLCFKQLTFLNEAISSWEKSTSHPPLFEFLSYELERIAEIQGSAFTVPTTFSLGDSKTEHVIAELVLMFLTGRLNVCSFSVCDTDSCFINNDLLEEDDPNTVNESELLVDYIKRFMHMFEAGDYEAAAFHAARSPHGVLRNTETMERFKSVTVNDGGLPPLLLYFQALMISAQPGKQLLGETLCLEGVHCALQHGYIDLITFWVTQHRLTYSEELGDVLCSHGDKDPRIADTCLALAHIIYTTCGVLRKTALCMCKRGLTIGALEFIYQNNFTLDDTMFVLKGCPSLTLLQGLTQKYGSKPALLSVGYVCHSLLSSYLEDLAFQLLEKIIADGPGSLEKAILDDMMCGTESWSEIAARCEQMNRPHLAQEIISTLLSQAGAVCLSPGSAKLMEHVFM